MSLSQIIKDLDLRLPHVVETTPAFYAAAAFNMFAITGGPIIIHALVEYLDTAMTNATTTTWTVNAVAADAGAVAINAGAIGSVVLSPVSAGAKTASALAVPWPTVVGVATQAGFGMIAGLGMIACTFATVMAAANRYSAHLIYTKLGKASLVRALF